MTSVDMKAEGGGPRDVKGIVQVLIPVSDLARSAGWYRDVLDLAYVREFCVEGRVTGCALADWAARYLVALRLRSSTAGWADLRGEHPIVLEAADPVAAERIRLRASALGISSTSGTHADGSWIEFRDPDDIAVRIVHSAAGPREFLGVRFASDGSSHHYDVPQLALPEMRPTG
jgi:hypothetical protein